MRWIICLLTLVFAFTTSLADNVAATSPVMHKAISNGLAAKTYQAFPDACRLKNGDILCVFYAGYGHVSLSADDYPLGGRICMVRSRDEGRTWSEPEILFDDEDDNRDPHIAQLDDGTLVCSFFSWGHKGERFKSYKNFNWKTFYSIAKNTGVEMVFSHDNGKTWDKESQRALPNWLCSAPVRQMADGTCFLGLYGKDHDQPTKRIYWPGVAISRDRCRTWETVNIPLPEGLSLDAETDVIRLNDGRLFAALRSSKVNMHYSTSSDEGKTWTTAADIGFKGHCPHLNRLSSGEIILCHREPNTSIHITRDETKTWEGPIQIDSCRGAYPATVELIDKSVLIVYYSEGEGSEIRVKRFRVKEQGVEFLPLE